MDAELIKKAIGMHGLWKGRLSHAIASGNSEFDSSISGREDACEFGKWLASVPIADRSDQWTKVREEHRLFHKAVGEILAKVEGGDKKGAAKLMENGSEYSKHSAACTMEMMDWVRQLG